MSSDINTLNTELDTLNETKQQIKQAIIDKGQPISSSDSFRSYVQKINDIQTGVDTSDADATPEDIILNKTAYVNGEKIKGTFPIYGNVSSNTTQPNSEIVDYPQTNMLRVITYTEASAGYIDNARIETDVFYDKLTEALQLTPEKIVKNNTVLGVAGTAEVGGLSVEETQQAEQLTRDILGI